MDPKFNDLETSGSVQTDLMTQLKNIDSEYNTQNNEIFSSPLPDYIPPKIQSTSPYSTKSYEKEHPLGTLEERKIKLALIDKTIHDYFRWYYFTMGMMLVCFMSLTILTKNEY